MTIDCPKWDTYITPSQVYSEFFRERSGKGDRENARAEAEEECYECCFMNMTWPSHYDFTVAVPTCTRLTQG